MKIYTLEDIKRAADLAAANAAINWEILDTEPKAVTYFVRSLEYGAQRVAMLEKVYKERVLAHVNPVTGELDTEAAGLRLEQADVLAEELHASYSMKEILATYHAIQEVTAPAGKAVEKPVAKKKRAPRKKKPKEE